MWLQPEINMFIFLRGCTRLQPVTIAGIGMGVVNQLWRHQARFQSTLSRFIAVPCNYTRFKCNKSALSLLRRLSTRSLLLSAGACSTMLAAIDRYLLQTPTLSSKSVGRRCCCGWMGQTDRRTDGRTDAQPLHKHSPHTLLAASIKVQVRP